ncbi:MAG: outer membrane beta-barrel protein [Aestuariibacter sp.]
MNKLFRALSAAALLVSGGVAADGWQVGASYLHLSDDSGQRIGLSALALTAGYEFEMTERFSVIPEVRLGIGTNKDDVNSLSGRMDVEIDRFTSLGVRLQYSFDNNVYLYAAPIWANLDISASSSSFSFSDDSSELGGAVGLGYRNAANWSFDAAYEKYDDTDTLQLGLRYHF